MAAVLLTCGCLSYAQRAEVNNAREVAESLVSLPQVCAGSVEYAAMQGPRKLVEYWRWRYRDPKTGRMCRTLFQLSEREAAELPQAQRIEGSMLLREVDADDFPDTGPEVHGLTPESQKSP
jgi:hypothetical protein